MNPETYKDISVRTFDICFPETSENPSEDVTYLIVQRATLFSRIYCKNME